jgi:hypothetical protein
MILRFVTGALLLLLLVAVAPATAQSDQRCFSETGQCISGPIRSYWERNGGLAVFGFPITAQAEETVEGRRLQVQWFERDRLEIQADGRVTAGRLGVEYLELLGMPWQQGPGVSAGPGCTAFPETGHQICGAFAAYWQANGGLERFGLPVTGEFSTELEGRPYTVQYFERRRFELHVGNQVLLGLLGRDVASRLQALAPQQPAPQQPAPPPPTATPVPPPTAVPAPASNCHPSYPTVCIPPPPPDLDCGDIPYRRFTVVGSDPHRFDGDNDGIGCER